MHSNSAPLVFAMTGASGAIYSVRALQLILAARVPVQLVVSSAARLVLQQELGIESKGDFNLRDAFASLNRFFHKSDENAINETTEFAESGGLKVYHQTDYFSPIASGSALTRGMLICPCSGSTLSSIAHSMGQNLIHRAAEVHIKERRKLVIVPRETPLSQFQLENMARLAGAGVTVLPAAPGWYHGVNELSDLVDFIASRILDQFQIPNSLIQRWASEPSE